MNQQKKLVQNVNFSQSYELLMLQIYWFVLTFQKIVKAFYYIAGCSIVRALQCSKWYSLVVFYTKMLGWIGSTIEPKINSLWWTLVCFHHVLAYQVGQKSSCFNGFWCVFSMFESKKSIKTPCLSHINHMFMKVFLLSF